MSDTQNQSGNPFLKTPDQYKRDLNIELNYRDDMALYLSKTTGWDLGECDEYIKRVTGKGGKFELKSPTTACLTRAKNGDREQTTTTLNEYLKDIVVNRRLFSPAMTVYLHPDEKVSVLSNYVHQNVAKRALIKKEAIKAKMEGNFALADNKENDQASYKTSNNSLSGTQVSEYNVLCNKSAHSSLTSTCRTATSYGNANNEKFIGGNRHYWCGDVVKANIVSIIRHVDRDLIAKVMDEFSLQYPTADEVMDCIMYSVKLYWKGEVELSIVRKLVDGLDPIDRAAFVYVGDMYHLRKHNDSFVRKFIYELSTKAKEPIDNPDDYIEGMDNDTKAFVSLLCTTELDGGQIGDLKEKDPRAYGIMGATVKNTFDVLNRYADVIHAFWVTDNVPASVAHIRNSIRRLAITSDTDSTIFTTQDWVDWYVGKIDFSEEANAVSYTMVYLATQAIVHVLAIQSTTMGVEANKLNVLAMKNEYAFPVFVLTSMAKHYYSYMSAREGNVFSELETEIKGVYLKDSNCPAVIMDKAQNLMREVMDNIMAGDQMSIKKLYRIIGGIEKTIVDSIQSGSPEYLPSGSIKDRGSYSNENPYSSPYNHYLMWQRVFSPTYGDSPAPPYPAVRVTLDIRNKTQMKQWVDSMERPEIVERMGIWMKESNKDIIATLMLPREVIEQSGIPPDVIKGINIRKLVYSITRPFYLILESLGIYMKNDDNTRLVYDYVHGEDNPI